MKTSIDRTNPTQVTLTITVDSDDLSVAEQRALKDLARTIRVAGFRKGKVPPAVAAKNVDPNALMQKTLEEAVNTAVAKAFVENSIQALDQPKVDVSKYIPGQEAEFSATAEVLPEVTLGDYKNLTATEKTESVTKADIDEIITRMQSGMATRKEVNRAAETGDEVTIDFTGYDADKVPFDGGSGKDYKLTLGSGQFIPGFEEGIVGHKAGETFDLPLTFPKEYGVKKLAGSNVSFNVVIHKIEALELPKLDDDFAAKAGPFKTITELRDDVKRELSTRKEADATNKLQNDLVQELADKSEAPLPESLVHEQVHAIQRDVQQNLSYQGITLEQYLEEQGMTADEWHDSTELRTEAEGRIKKGLVLAELGKQENINVTEDQVDARLSEMMSQYTDPKSQEELASPQARREITNRLLTEKTIERLVELNKKKPVKTSK